MTGARALYETLRACGVTHVFGLDSPEALYAEMDRAEMRPITVRDERAGAIMADAYARVSGRPGVCTAIRGPGATNLITGLAEAWASSIPVVAIVNDVNTAVVGRNPIQEVDHLALFRPITKWAVRLDRPERVSELTARAFVLATCGRPGPTLVSCPDDVLAAGGATSSGHRPGARRYPHLRTAPDPAAVREAVLVLGEAARPAIIAGGGVLSACAWEELLQVAELLDAPVATTPLGKGAIDEAHPLAAGVMSAYTGGEMGRGRIANGVIRDADVVLLVGTKTGNVATSNWTLPDPSCRTVHVDVDVAEIGRNYRSLGVLGDAKLGLAALAAGLEAAGARPATGRRADLARDLSDWRARKWVIEPSRQGFRARVEEVWRYRRIMWFLARQRVRDRYDGLTLGPFWLLARPLMPILIGTLIFGGLLGVDSGGPVPYFLFFLTGTSCWRAHWPTSLTWWARSGVSGPLMSGCSSSRSISMRRS